MKINHYLIPLAITGFLSTGMAATDDPELRFYDVEVILFKNDLGPKYQEYVLPVASPRVDDEILDLSSASSIEAARERLYEIIPTEELRLTEQVISIIKSNRYSLLAHAGWRQPGLDKEQVMPVWIKGGRLYGDEYTSIDNQIDLESMVRDDSSNPEEIALTGEIGSDEVDQSLAEQALPGSTDSLPESEALDPTLQDSNSSAASLTEIGAFQDAGLYELEGKITVALARYLHTEAELVLRKPRLAIEDLTSDEIEISQLGAEIQSDIQILDNHSLHESRRMRSKVLHYLDSPEFSMLVLITPYEIPVQANTADPELVEEPVESAVSGETQQ